MLEPEGVFREQQILYVGAKRTWAALRAGNRHEMAGVRRQLDGRRDPWGGSSSSIWSFIVLRVDGNLGTW